MDETQKILIKAGRKDLAQKYYEKVAEIPNPKYKKHTIQDLKDKQEYLMEESSQSGKSSSPFLFNEMDRIDKEIKIRRKLKMK